jgi:uncharacterized protein YdhG (YjbR/CyaY superfamily)
MQSAAATPDEYYANLPEDRKATMLQLRKVLKKNLPKGFQEVMNYGMPGFVVPHKLYPAGYHCKPEDPLPFIGLASQKNSINFYHMGIYAEPKLLKWFTSEFTKHSKKKLDMGKSCVRFKKAEDIPFELLGELAAKITPQQWINLYEEKLKR